MSEQETSDPELSKNWYEHGWAMGAFALGALFIWSLGVIPYAYSALNSSGALQPSPAGAGVFGDSFGAINALLSALGVAFVALALLKQQAELQHTRRELGETLKANQEMAEHQAKSAEEQQRAVAIEALRIHCDALQAQLTASLEMAHHLPGPWTLERDEACQLANFYSAELARATKELVRSSGPADSLLRRVEELSLRTLAKTLEAISYTAEGLAQTGRSDGVLVLKSQTEALLNALADSGFPKLREYALNLDDQPSRELVKKVAAVAMSGYQSCRTTHPTAKAW